jgi:hypothetical protein
MKQEDGVFLDFKLGSIGHNALSLQFPVLQHQYGGNERRCHGITSITASWSQGATVECCLQ